MTDDARFEDGAEQALHLRAFDTDDLVVVSTLVQDAVLSGADMRWQTSQRRFSLLLNRFRWEEKGTAEARKRGFERVRSLLMVEDVLKVRSQGVPRDEAETVLSILSIEFEPGEDGTGTVTITFAGDGAIALEVEALGLVLRDVTRPYLAQSKRAPSHPD